MHAQGTSRGGADIKEIVKRIDMWAIDMVCALQCVWHQDNINSACQAPQTQKP